MPKTNRRPVPPHKVAGIVEWFDADQGWGVISAAEVPGGCFVHFSVIKMVGFRELRAGQRVQFTYHDPGFRQDGCPFRAQAVWPAG